MYSLKKKLRPEIANEKTSLTAFEEGSARSIQYLATTVNWGSVMSQSHKFDRFHVNMSIEIKIRY